MNEGRVSPDRSYALISRGQLARNYRAVKAAVGPDVEVLGVVKADAYGHGAVEVSRVLEAEGARWLAVSSVEEGVALRRAGVAARILVMAGFLPRERPALAEYRLTPVVHALADIAELEAPFHLKVDTGLTRLGARCGAAEILAALAAYPSAKLEGLMTHFASAADYNSLQTAHQVEAFRQLYEALRQAGRQPAVVHTSSTNAIAYPRRAAWYNMVRPGHALYGYVSPARGEAPHKVLDVKPVLTWKAKILAVKEVPEGTLIGYGATFRAPRPMRLGVLALGYGDGLPHRLSNKGRVIADGKLVPIVGTVSMDLTTIDLTAAPVLAPGDEVTILGEEGEARQDAQQIARQAGTISYAVLCGISPRVRRVYVE
ncbi:MAG: alanine racemase [Candidatus Solibacter usitatus]|nr:alanine racemase [Candidatus Solibacter usitatus]